MEDMAPSGKCAKMVSQCNEVQNTSAFKQTDTSFAPVKHNLALAWNVSDTAVPDVNDLWDNFYARLWHNMSLASGVTQDEFNAVQQVSMSQFDLVYNYKDVARLGIGVFLGEVMARFEDHIKNRTSLKWVYYSAHDTTVGPFLAAFGLLKDWPPYASHIVLEVYADTTPNYFLRFLYNDQVQTVPGCPSGTEFCPFEIFSDIAYKSVMTQADWASECASTGPAKGIGWVGMYLC